MAYRWEMDLSPGTRRHPRTKLAGSTVVAVETASFMRELYSNGIRPQVGQKTDACARAERRVSYASVSEIGHIVRLEFPSHFDMLDLVQALSDHMGQVGKLDEDSAHWVGVAVRESVINAIKHGNKEDDKKRVSVEFRFEPIEEPTQFVVRIVDQGEGFNPVEVADPLEPENLLKSSGRASSSCAASWTM